MSKNVLNTRIWGDPLYAVWTAPLGTALPTTPTAALNAAFLEVGLLSDAGMTEAHTFNETKTYDMAGSLVRIGRNQEERPWTFTALETNAVSVGLKYPNTTVTTSGGTPEVQTLTVTATGGTFTLTGGYGGFGTTSPITVSGLSSATLQTAIRTLPGFGAVTVTGAGPYVITFPSSLGDVVLLSVDNTLATGGTASNVQTTQGVLPVNTRAVGSGLVSNLRAFVLDRKDGVVVKRIVVPNGEAIWTGTETSNSSTPDELTFTLNTYKDTSGNYFYAYDNDATQGVAYA